MKNITKSLLMITAVAALAIGGTVAYFSDTETSTGNSFTAGTIDIAVDNNNPWNHQGYDIGDLKPGETGNMTFTIKNVGTNPANISKSLYNLTPYQTTGQTYNCAGISGANYDASSEPECVAEAGTPVDDVKTQLIYGLAVKVYASEGATTPIWWQEIYKNEDNKKLSDVYPTETNFVELGMIPSGGHMVVTQTYKFNPEADNKYQGDGLKFDMQIKADQMAQVDGYTSTALENKDGGSDWHIIADDVDGVLNYKTKGAMFTYNFTGRVKTAGDYKLIYVGSTNDYPCTGSVLLGQGTFNTTSDVTISGQADTGSIANGKVWLVPASSYSGTMTSWPQEDILFETDLINYVEN